MANDSDKPKTLVQSPNYGKASIWDKGKRKIRITIVSKIHGTFLQFKAYKSYWHYLLSGKKKHANKPDDIKKTWYIGQKPNYGAGIGHQLANWNAGLYIADFFGCQFAHYPFSTEKWDTFLGFGEGEVKAADLQKNNKFKKVQLPRFDLENAGEVEMIKNIVNSYTRPDILFQLEMDQGYGRQCDTSATLAKKFFNASARLKQVLGFDKKVFNIALHIRRRMKIETEEVWKTRGLDNSYYANVLTEVLSTIGTEKKVQVWFFSQGVMDDFPEFEKFNNIKYCLDMGPIESVLHMIYADLLISSKSSFSYKPALISDGIQICPASFWHNYPDEPKYILADNDGHFDKSKLRTNLKSIGVIN